MTTIVNCIRNRSLLHLQQICSKTSSFGCGIYRAGAAHRDARGWVGEMLMDRQYAM
jgi:hypothetical protein